MFQRHRPDTRIHFVGIGGIGMSGIAEVLLTMGYRVSGSDLRASDLTRRLEQLGGVVRIGHAEEHLQLLGDEADVVVVSSAVPPDNPEVRAARRRGVPVIPRAEMLAELMRMKFGVAVAGSHGKTTTTSLVATILRHAGLDPTAVIGGKLPQLGGGARLGQSEYLVAEADESDGSFLHLSPTVAVVTNIDPEHLDHYGSFDRLVEAFVQFVNKVPFYGLGVLCLDHGAVQALLPRVGKRHVTYGMSPQADYQARSVCLSGLRTRFVALRRGTVLGEVELPMPGEHNVLNALAALAVADFLGIPFATYSEAVAGFEGVGRRFTVRGEVRGIMVVDDYGHHPAEIRATLRGARNGFVGRRVLVAFQPHRYTRTRDLLGEFACAFNDAEVVVVCDIYPAGERPIEGVSAERLVAEMQRHGHRGVRYVPRRADVAAALLPELRPGDMVITLGAGDIWQSGEELLALLREETSEKSCPGRSAHPHS
ncbi:MAG: UDP-N-acetylmuramate--L-alanine ligase [Myxococcota bacterium]|nr:UDP-N-acetylmuramate--L-alanine ligase [Myxococcota bacterium]